ncbi:MAG: glycosyltransferase family 9 protein [Chitinophagia bacterium]|jgi:ADP-heptose:LPS heptosyltransferase
MRLLFIRFSSIGDIVFTTPAIRCAKQQIPGVELHFLTKASMKAVTEANPYIDHFHYFDKDLNATIKGLKAFQFDYIIDLHRNLRTFQIQKALGVPSLSYHKLSLQKLLLTKLHLNYMPARHIVDRSLDTLSALGVVNDGKGLDYFIPKEATLPSNALPAAFQSGYIALVIGASYATKKLPVASLQALCHKIPYPIVLIGGKEDQAEGAAIEAINPIKIWNACGKFNLHESALLVKQSKTVISHDTGFLYIACAFHKKTVAIWGATAPALQVEPYYPTKMDSSKKNVWYYNAIVPNLPCQPCSNFGTKQCPQGHFACMKKQDLQSIADKAIAYFKATIE